MTSRTKQSASGITVNEIEVQPLSSDSSRALLQMNLAEERKAAPCINELCDEICEKLGYLPLAIDLISAGLGTRELSSVAENLNQNPIEELERWITILRNTGPNINDAVSEVFSRTFLKLSAEAREVIYLLSHLSNNTVPSKIHSLFSDWVIGCDYSTLSKYDVCLKLGDSLELAFSKYDRSNPSSWSFLEVIEPHSSSLLELSYQFSTSVYQEKLVAIISELAIFLMRSGSYRRSMYLFEKYSISAIR